VDLSDVTMDLMTKLWIAERVTPGTDRFARLIRAIPDPNEIYRADAECLEKIFSKHCRDIKRLLDKSMDDVERIVEFCALRNIRILTYWDDAYPAKLREIADPPAWLFLLGTLPSLEKEFAVFLSLDGFHKASVNGFKKKGNGNENRGIEFLHVLQNVLEAVAESNLCTAVGCEEKDN
jgi:hypothetical protein